MRDRVPGDVTDDGSRISFGIGPSRRPIRSSFAAFLGLSVVVTFVRIVDPWLGGAVGLFGLGAIALWWRAHRQVRAFCGPEGTRIRFRLSSRSIPAGRPVRVSADEGPVVLTVDGEEVASAELPWSGGAQSAVGMRALAARIAAVTGGAFQDDLDEAAFEARRAARSAQASAAVDGHLESMKALWPEVYAGDPVQPMTRAKLQKERYHVEDGAPGRGRSATQKVSLDAIEPIGLDANTVGVLDLSWPVAEVDRAFVTVSRGGTLELVLLVVGERIPIMERKNVGSAAAEMRWIASRIEEVAARARPRRGGDVPDALKGLVRQTE
ncbi:MAG: hypothetical protein H6737_20815 [Alphaproteobacteria bacterium]|nr:hypothetical protein [Alphaproteobacteria bacterium]